jgi:hypothetical protein
MQYYADEGQMARFTWKWEAYIALMNDYPATDAKGWEDPA